MADLITNFNRTFITDSRYKLFLQGLEATLVIAFFATIIGILIGILVAVLKVYIYQSKGQVKNGFLKVVHKIIDLILDTYLTLFRGTPVVVQLMILFYLVFTWINQGIYVAILGFGINSGAYVSEIVRGGILSIDKGQTEAGRSLGLTSWQTMRCIVLPQAFKNILPALFNEFIALLKETSVAGYITVIDLTKAADLVRSRTFQAFFPLISIAIIYLVLVIGLTWVQRSIERRLRKSDRH
ncbi:MAG: amino acid ABC transporter permease [Bacillota bacterium]|nr:amino acid ABC transporter permease [Bacillota bacterium]